MEPNPYESPQQTNVSQPPPDRGNGGQRVFHGLFIAVVAIVLIDTLGVTVLPMFDNLPLVGAVIVVLGWALVPVVFGGLAYAFFGFTDWAMSFRKSR